MDPEEINKRANEFAHALHKNGGKIAWLRNGKIEQIPQPLWTISPELSKLAVEAGDIIRDFERLKNG